MTTFCTLSGATFILSISLLLTCHLIKWVKEIIQEKHHSYYAEWANTTCQIIDRDCGVEFPQVGFLANYIREELVNRPMKLNYKNVCTQDLLDELREKFI